MPIDTATRLRDDLMAASFTLDGVTTRLGDAAITGLSRNSTFAARDQLGSAADPQAALIGLFLLHEPLTEAVLRRALSRPDALRDAGILTHDDGVWRAAIEIRPYGADDWQGWVACDLTPGLDTVSNRPAFDFVLGPSPASTSLAELTVRTPVESALDLGTGCGIQSVHLAQHVQRIVATDVNPRALWMAGITAALNAISLDLRDGSLYEPVRDERFDLITTNPPYVMSPPQGRRLTYREGFLAGDALVQRIVTEGPSLLRPGGTLQVLGNWAITRQQTFEERLTSWIRPTGCDALVLQREVLDPYEYIEIWLADAGLSGTPEYAQRYRAWLDYFQTLDITAVGMGWITLYKLGRDVPRLRLEEWPHAVAQPVGLAFAAFPDAVTSAHLPREGFLRRHWVRAEHVVQETVGEPGADDPHHLILRQQLGFRRAVETDTALAAVVGACDGEMALADLIRAVSALLDVDPDDLADDLLPRLRELVEDGYLV